MRRAKDRLAVAVAGVILTFLPLEMQYERFRRALNSSISSNLVNERKSLAVICVPFAANHLMIPNELDTKPKEKDNASLLKHIVRRCAYIIQLGIQHRIRPSKFRELKL